MKDKFLLGTNTIIKHAVKVNQMQHKKNKGWKFCTAFETVLNFGP